MGQAQRPRLTLAPTGPLVFRGVTVIDVEHGRRLPDQTVVIAERHIQVVGPTARVTPPPAARVINARGRYLIPGLWDMHFHPWGRMDYFYPLLIANGITGVRDMYDAEASLDTMLRWRRSVRAGEQVGPRSLVTDRYVHEPDAMLPALLGAGVPTGWQRGPIRLSGWSRDTSVTAGGDDLAVDLYAWTAAEAREIVDSMQAAGADHVKIHGGISGVPYYALLAEGRRRGIPVVGHLSDGVSIVDASDSGQRTLEHLAWLVQFGALDGICVGPTATDATCAALAERFRRNETWIGTTVVAVAGRAPGGSVLSRLPDPAADADQGVGDPPDWPASVLGRLARVGMPLLAGAEPDYPATFLLHEELAMLVASGLTPLQALQSATWEPARYLEATDSMGTVAAGKVADLVLLDADPLVRITNTAAVRAVVANGRYYDRTALDALLRKAAATARTHPPSDP